MKLQVIRGLEMRKMDDAVDVGIMQDKVRVLSLRVRDMIV